MLRYFFDARSIEWDYNDPDGILLSDDNAAVAYAERIVRELNEDDGYKEPDLLILVKNETGHPIFSIPVNPTKDREFKRTSAVSPAGII